MSEAEAYEIIREYFSRPGAKLSKQGTVCYYRHPEDMRACAVGCLLTHDEVLAMSQLQDHPPFRSPYDLEGSVGHIMELESFPDRLKGMGTYLTSVQVAHDNSKSVDTFLTKLDKIPRGV